MSERTPLLSKHVESLIDPTKLPIRTRNLILTAMWLGVFMGALDLTLLTTLVSDISSAFQSSQQSSWLGTSYLLSTATFTPIYGRLSDIIGRRGAALSAISFFTVGTLICGIAPSMKVLLMGRFIAGIGGGGMMSVSSIVASDVVPLRQRALFQGLANLFFGLGSGIGGPLGGFISDSIGWRMAFLIQIPLLLLSTVAIFIFVRYEVPGQSKSKKEMLSRVDYGGSLSLLVALGSLLFGLSFKNNENLQWTDKFVYIPLSTFSIFTVVFILIEGYHAVEPVMPLRFLAMRNGLFVSLSNFTMSMVSFSILFFFPMFFEVVKQQSASLSGSHLLPNSIALSFGSLAAGFIIRKTGQYYWLIVISSLFPIIALTLMAFLDENSSTIYQYMCVAPAGLGFASVVTSLLIALVSSVDRADMATATGLSYLFRYVGQVVGVALSSSLLQSVLTSQLKQRITGEGAAEIIDKIRHVATSIPDLSPEIQIAARASYGTGLRAVFIFNAGVAFVCFLCTLPLIEYALPGSFEEEDEARRQRVDSGTATPVRS